MSRFFPHYNPALADPRHVLNYIMWGNGGANPSPPGLTDYKFGNYSTRFHMQDVTTPSGFVYLLDVANKTGTTVGQWLNQPNAASDFTDPYFGLAYDAAVLIGRERNDLLRASGSRPLVEFDSIEWTRNFWRDLLYAYRYFALWDSQFYYPGNGPESNDTFDGIVIITPQLQDLRELTQNITNVKQREDATLSRLSELGVDLRIIRDISSRTATDPLGRFIIANIVGQAVPGVAPEIHSGIVGNTNLPASDINILSQIEEQERLLTIASSEIDLRQQFFNAVLLRESKDQSEARDYLYWLGNHPEFKILASHNQHVTGTLLQRAWPVGTDEIPPLVNVTVTPKGLPRPELGWLEKNVSWLGPLVSIAVPFVGGVVSMIIKAKAASNAKNLGRSIQIPTSAFVPQYEPVTPFDVVLPLNLAQYVVTHPEFGPAVIAEFTTTLANGDLVRLRDLMVDFVKAPPASDPGSANNLKPLAVTAQEIVTGRAIQPGELKPVSNYVPDTHINDTQLGAGTINLVQAVKNAQSGFAIDPNNIAGGAFNVGSPAGNLTQSNPASLTNSLAQGAANNAAPANASGQNATGGVLLAGAALLAVFLFTGKK